MAGGGASKSSNAPRIRKRVEVDTDTDTDSTVASASASSSASLKRARDGSAFVRCEGCNKDVPVVLISMHNCSLDAKIKMNLEAQVVEKAAEVKKKPLVEKKKSTSGKGKKEKKAKDPNKPKRPLTAFFLFMADFRKTFKEANPDCKSVSQVGKEGGEKWKSMTDEEKKPYLDKAAELKSEFEKKTSESPENEDGGESQDEEGSSEKKAKVEAETVSDEE